MARKANTTQTKHASVQGNRIEAFLFGGSREVAMPRLMFIMAVIALTVLGIVMVYSSSTIEAIHEGASPVSYVKVQLIATAIAIILCLAISRLLPYYKWLGWWLAAYWIISMILFLAVAVAGTTGLGAQRWLVIGGRSIQPSELVKAMFVLAMARIMYETRVRQLGGKKFMLLMVLVAIPLVFMLITQSDLGSTIICGVGILAAAWLGDAPKKQFFSVMGISVLLAAMATFLVDYRRARVLIMLHPENDAWDTGLQLMQSRYAFGTGGVFGVGLGNSAMKYQYLPEAETDFIFAIIGEELGLVGCLVVIALFLVLLYAGIDIARKAPDTFGTMVAGGCTAMLVFQAFLNMACVVGVFPTTGKPLPFISSGGTALIGSYILVGIILSVSFASGSDSGVYKKRREEFKVVRAGSSSGGSSGSSSRGSSGSRSGKTSGSSRKSRR